MQITVDTFGWRVGMADYQFQPYIDDPVARLRLAMDNMDGNIIQSITRPFHDIDRQRLQLRLFAPIPFLMRRRTMSFPWTLCLPTYLRAPTPHEAT